MNWKQKLSSRKLWACVAGVIMGLAMAFGLDGDTISTVAGAVTSLVSIITYVVTEGKIDAAAVAQVYTDIETITAAVKDSLKEDISNGTETLTITGDNIACGVSGGGTE